MTEKKTPHTPSLHITKGDNQNIIFKALKIDSLNKTLQYFQEFSHNRKEIIIINSSLNTDSGALKNLPEHSQVYVTGKLHFKNSKNWVYFDSIKNLIKISFNNANILVIGDFKNELDFLENNNHNTTLHINLNKVNQNITYFKSKLRPTTKLMVMVKAFSYGTGAIEMPFFIQHQVDYFGVAYANEGVKLRKNNIATPILVMNTNINKLNEIIVNCLEPNIHNIETLKAFISLLKEKNIKNYPIHLKIDTGMSRLGFFPDEINKALNIINKHPEVKVKSVFSHLSSAGNPNEKEFTNQQIERFKTTKNTILNNLHYPPLFHLLNSAGIENYTESQFDMVRLGIGLYGINTSFQKKTTPTPIATLTSTITQVKTIKKGESVGYGRGFIAQEDTKVGTIPIGYADGIRRALGNENYKVWINGKLAPIIGNVCMDACMINLNNIPAKEGDVIEFFGENLPIENLAKTLNTIPYEVLTSVSQRVKRVYTRFL